MPINTNKLKNIYGMKYFPAIKNSNTNNHNIMNKCQNIKLGKKKKKALHRKRMYWMIPLRWSQMTGKLNLWWQEFIEQ